MLHFGIVPRYIRYILHASSPILWLITVLHMNIINLFFSEIKHIKYMKDIVIITQIWHVVKCYSTCIRNTWYLITTPNINNMNLFFWEISQQTHEKWPQLLKFGKESNTILQTWALNGTWYVITVQNMNKITALFDILQQTFKIYEKINIITQI